MPNPTLDELYEKALRALLTRIGHEMNIDPPEGLQALSVAVNTLESARIVARSSAQMTDFEHELVVVDEDPNKLPN